FMALIDPGDEVLIPAPYWVSYPDMVMLAGGRPVILETKAEDDFAVTAAQVAAACTGRTRAIVLNNPSNPTGAVYSRAQIEALAKVVVEKDLLVISDDIYRQLVYGDAEYVSIASISPELARRTILVDGVSKTYAMTGWRIGYTAVAKELAPLIKAMSKIQGQSTSNPTNIAQVATVAALTGPQDCVATMRKAFDERRLEMVKLLRAIPGVNCREPKGAFYAFPDVSAYVGKKSPEGSILDDDVQLCDWLVEVGKVAVVPGSGFGAPGFVRLSYACSMENIREGVGRLAKALGSLT
ncbi:MAG: pyridoxal phosphate-dependent aminotransferase, partial [Kofleriaceae bacterium]|nr:pyridoxal phosphate-dependent aminotransferase [Kofleriaceae bacterium]